MMMNFLPLILLILFHLHLFQFKCYGLNFAMLDVLQVSAVLLLQIVHLNSLATQECININTGKAVNCCAVFCFLT